MQPIFKGLSLVFFDIFQPSGFMFVRQKEFFFALKQK